MENKEIKYDFVYNEEESQRVDLYLGTLLEEVSRSYVQKLIKTGNVTVNGEVIKVKKLILKNDDVVEIIIPEPEVLKVEAQNLPIEVVYSDDDVIIVNKPAGMVVHPAPGNYDGTLVNALMYHFGDQLSSINGVIRPGIVHRIDKDTSGLLMIAKNDKAHKSLAAQLKSHTTTRKYMAIVHGVINEEKGTVNKPIGRSATNRLKMSVVKGGKEAVTHFKVLKRYKNYTVIECQLETGRTHQIRVHMANIGKPILGDPLYGPKKTKIKHDGQLLHAKTLGFIHPTTNEYVEFNSELPEHFTKIISKIEGVEMREV